MTNNIRRFSILTMIGAMAFIQTTARDHQEPATVIITAGQSNTDGRCINTTLPDYIQKNKYHHCLWNFGSSKRITNGFQLFWPRMGASTKYERWAYDAVTYYWLEKALQKKFYVIKWSHGGTAIDTTCASSSHLYWEADSAWLSRNKSTIAGGHSLLKSFTTLISESIDSTLCQLPEGYSIKAFLWHQGESDQKAGERYYQNLKNVVSYVRKFLVDKTGNKKYASLPFICGTVSHHNKRFSKEVESALFQLEKEDHNFYVIDMSDAELQKDELHFVPQAAEYLGKQIYNRLVDLKAAGRKAKKVK